MIIFLKLASSVPSLTFALGLSLFTKELFLLTGPGMKVSVVLFSLILDFTLPCTFVSVSATVELMSIV